MKKRYLLYRMLGFEEKSYCEAVAISDWALRSFASLRITVIRLFLQPVKPLRNSVRCGTTEVVP